MWASFTHLKTSKGPTYDYICIKAQEKGNPCILLLHGFPSSSYDWRHQIHYFAERGYGVVAPDLLGYGGTDKPQDVMEYRAITMAEAIIEILDHEEIEAVIGVAHDWGCVLLSRLANYFSSRFLSYAFLAVPYYPPGVQLDIDTINKSTAKTLGYPIYGYWPFFLESDAAELLNTHFESFFSIIYTEDPELLKTEFAPIGALRKWLAQDLMAPQPSFISYDEKTIHNRIFSEHGGYGPSLNWYKAMVQNVNEEDEKDIPENMSILRQPVLLISGSDDPIVLSSVAEQATRPYTSNLTVQEVKAGHWVQLQAKDQTNKALEDFFTKVLGN